MVKIENGLVNKSDFLYPQMDQRDFSFEKIVIQKLRNLKRFLFLIVLEGKLWPELANSGCR